MLIRKLRETRKLSQEQLAETTALSLRTIQRAEAGHRVSYASLRALAAAFEINVDSLELELYAVNKSSNEYEELPLWVRLCFGRGRIRAVSRRDLRSIEVGVLVMGLFALALSLLLPPQELILGISSITAMRFTALIGLLNAYAISISIRIGDKYNVWPLTEPTIPQGIFGFGLGNAKRNT